MKLGTTLQRPMRRAAMAFALLTLFAACTGDDETPTAGTTAHSSPAAATEDVENEIASTSPVETKSEPEMAGVIAQQLQTGLAADPSSVLSADAEFTDEQVVEMKKEWDREQIRLKEALAADAEQARLQEAAETC